MGPNLSIKMRISIGNNRFANVECLVHTDSVFVALLVEDHLIII